MHITQSQTHMWPASCDYAARSTLRNERNEKIFQIYYFLSIVQFFKIFTRLNTEIGSYLEYDVSQIYKLRPSDLLFYKCSSLIDMSLRPLT